MLLLRQSAEEGAIVRAYDPRAIPHARQVLPDVVKLVGTVEDCAAGARALVLMTEWPEIVQADWREIVHSTRLPRFFFDGRNALDAAQMMELGFDYRGVGRGSRALSKTRHHGHGQ